MPSPQGQIAPHIQAALNNHFAALSQQLGQQLAMGAMTAPGIPARPPQSNQLHQSSTVPQPSFQQVITHQQQARAAAGRQGVADVPAADAANGNTNRQAQAQLPEQATPPGSMPSQTSPGPGSTNTVVHEEQGPNGNNWRITVNESTFTIPNANAGHDHMPGVDTMPLASFGSHGSFNVPADGLSPSMAGLQSEVIQARPTTFSPPDQDLETQRRVWMQLVAPMQQVMSTLERMIASGYAPSEDQVNEVRSQLQDIMRHRNAIPEVHQRTMNARLSYISSGAEQVRRNVGRNATITPNVQQSAMSVPISATPMVYLLSSPSGPHALLVSPSGLYSTAPRIVPFPTDPRPLAANLQQQRFNQAQVPNRLGDIHAQQPAPHDPLNHAQPGQQQWAQARDIARILLPLGGHLWLLIRLFGFVYFFTAGGGWRRAILLGVGAFMVFIAQTGIFRPFQQAVWEPLRRHLEGLVPLAGNERPNVGGAPGAAAPVGVNGDQRPVGGEPEIRQVAERLLRERDQRDVGLVRQYLRRLERAVAIFLASLVPGIGERHIAARDAAEAIRMVEEREREEERVRGEEVPEEQGVGEPTHRETGPNAEANSSNEDNGGVTQPQQPQQGQPPLVEI